eukprot:20521-Heterococcus_DN1.PRE.2
MRGSPLYVPKTVSPRVAKSESVRDVVYNAVSLMHTAAAATSAAVAAATWPSTRSRHRTSTAGYSGTKTPGKAHMSQYTAKNGYQISLSVTQESTNGSSTAKLLPQETRLLTMSRKVLTSTSRAQQV